MTESAKIKDGSIDYHKLTPDLRRLLRGGGGATSSQITTTIENKIITQTDSYDKDRLATIELLTQELLSLHSQILADRRIETVWLDNVTDYPILEQIPIVLPYKNEKLRTAFYDNNNYRYYANQDGAIFVSALFGIMISELSMSGINGVFLEAWKNNTDYWILDYKNVINNVSAAEILHGSTAIGCKCGDYIDIRLFIKETNLLQEFGVNDLRYGYVTYNFEGCNYEELNTPNLLRPNW